MKATSSAIPSYFLPLLRTLLAGCGVRSIVHWASKERAMKPLGFSLLMVGLVLGAGCSDDSGTPGDAGPDTKVAPDGLTDDGTSDGQTPDGTPGPDGAVEPPEYTNANAVRGARLYDKWWAVINAAAPTGDHSLYPSTGSKSGADTWRCKECHGWDYQGKDGAYKSGSHATGIKGV